MSTINDAYHAWTAAVQQPGNVSLDDATDILQTFGRSLTDADGDAWWNALSVEFGRLGVITPGTYVGLRNHANGNEQGANDLFDGLISTVNAMPETAPVTRAILLQDKETEKAGTPGNVTRVEALKSGGTSVEDIQFDASLDAAIDALAGRAVQLTDEITALEGTAP